MCGPKYPGEKSQDVAREVTKGSPHYQTGGIEVLDVLRAKLTREQFEGFLLGNLIKYALRYNFMDEKKSDLEKCLHYCELWREEVLLGRRGEGS